VTSIPPAASLDGDERYGSGDGSPGERAKARHRKGASASHVTTQGEMLVAKFFARNGPSGWYSHT
jgi:hypothetical protein